MSTTPIAILIYRRPALARGLLTALQVHQPKKIWIIADGPKGESENELCSAARQQAEKGITWECEVIKIYADQNLGLKERVETGLDKLFAHENSAIILEEDCQPNPQELQSYADQLTQAVKKNSEKNKACLGNISHMFDK
jgi:hypothetical protein